MDAPTLVTRGRTAKLIGKSIKSATPDRRDMALQLIKSTLRLLPNAVVARYRCRSQRCLALDSSLRVSNLKPYVEPQLSYAYGRSEHSLIYKTIGEMLEERVQQETGKPMVVSHYEHISRTFTQFHEDVNRLAHSMSEHLGLARGDVAAIWSANSYRWLVIQYACARLGLILCTINPFYQAGELEYVLEKGDVKALFVPGRGSPQESLVNGFGRVLAEVLRRPNSTLKHIIAMDGQEYSGSDIPLGQAIRMHSLDRLIQGNGDLDRKLTRQVSPDDAAIIIFTSGTTGKPKGALLSHFSVLNDSRLVSLSIGGNAHQTLAIPLPLFHTFASMVGSLGMTVAPFKLVIPFLKYDVRQLVEAINVHEVSQILATPTLVVDVLNYVRSSGAHLPSLASVIAGGATMAVDIARQFVATVPSCKDFAILYGATELGPVATRNRFGDTLERRTETLGTPLDFTEIKIVDSQTKRAVPHGQPGEIYSRGFNTMLGYWKEPEKTREVLDASGWYSTGDLGTMDSEGYVRIIGRSKELIIVGGENVYPREIEELLHGHPAVLDVYVIGIPDSRKGEEICAWIRLRPDHKASVTEEELKRFCKGKISYFKVPKQIIFVDSFPTTASGKVQKFAMRDIMCQRMLQEEKSKTQGQQQQQHTN